jgi:hypothetical protein
MPKRKSSSGFTLISFGVTLGVVALFMAFSLPNMAAIHKTYTLSTQHESLRAWAQIARDTGLTMAKFENLGCAPGQSCEYKKFGAKRECVGPGKGGMGMGIGDHYYADGYCRYNLSKGSHRIALQRYGYVLPALDPISGYTNSQNGRPIFLLHDDHQVQAFTCVDKTYVDTLNLPYALDVTPDSPYSLVCNANAHKVLFAALPDMHRAFRKALERRLRKGDGDDFFVGGGLTH